ncbi:MAG: hypothetical protein ACJ76V_12425 [Thermoleophilaceae bacterium]
MSEAAVSLAFFDRANDIHGTLRQGLTLLFEGGKPQAIDEPLESERSDGRYTAALGDRLELRFGPLTDAVDIGGATARLCSVEGTVDGSSIECLGVATETVDPPQWAELDCLRNVCALFDPDNAVIAVARRPRGALGHGAEDVIAWLLAGGELTRVQDARVSTVYDGDGRQRNAGLELWLPEQDFPRRLSGSAVAGTTLSLEGLRVNAAVFEWRMEGREGAGAYELTVRDEEAAA